MGHIFHQWQNLSRFGCAKQSKNLKRYLIRSNTTYKMNNLGKIVLCIKLQIPANAMLLQNDFFLNIIPNDNFKKKSIFCQTILRRRLKSE